MPVSPCLYQTLGIGKSADSAAITKASRKLAKRYHPDHNPGDDAAAAKFREIDTAYQVLSDPERRKRYDETGDAEVLPSEAQETAQAIGELTMCLSATIAKMAEQGASVTSRDVLKEMKATMEEGIASLAKQRRELEKSRSQLAEVASRIEAVDGAENLLAQAATIRTEAMGKGLEQIDGRINRIRKAMAHLERYRYRFIEMNSFGSLGASWRNDGFMKNPWAFGG